MKFLQEFSFELILLFFILISFATGSEPIFLVSALTSLIAVRVWLHKKGLK